MGVKPGLQRPGMGDSATSQPFAMPTLGADPSCRLQLRAAQALQLPVIVTEQYPKVSSEGHLHPAWCSARRTPAAIVLCRLWLEQPRRCPCCPVDPLCCHHQPPWNATAAFAVLTRLYGHPLVQQALGNTVEELREFIPADAPGQCVVPNPACAVCRWQRKRIS